MNDLVTWGRGDIVDVRRVLNDASAYGTFSALNIDEAVFDDANVDPDLLLCSRVDGEITGVVGAVARVTPGNDGPPVGFIKLLAVAPKWQGKGIGPTLLAEAENRLKARGVSRIQIFGDAPSYLRPGVDFRLTRLICMLLRRGYVSRHNATNMEVDLARAALDTAAEERRLIGAEIEIRRLAAYDAEAFSAYMATQWSWGWQVEALRSLRRDPVSCHIALRHGEILGFAACDVSGPGQFGPMGTRTDLRKYGIGGVLLKRCLADLRDAGYATADIQWVGPFPFYARQVGATMSRCYWQMAKTVV